MDSFDSCEVFFATYDGACPSKTFKAFSAKISHYMYEVYKSGIVDERSAPYSILRPDVLPSRKFVFKSPVEPSRFPCPSCGSVCAGKLMKTVESKAHAIDGMDIDSDEYGVTFHFYNKAESMEAAI